MESPQPSPDRLARYFVISVAILALVIVAWFDINSKDVRVPDIVYWILGGAILGVSDLIKLIKIRDTTKGAVLAGVMGLCVMYIPVLGQIVLLSTASLYAILLIIALLGWRKK